MEDQVIEQTKTAEQAIADYKGMAQEAYEKFIADSTEQLKVAERRAEQAQEAIDHKSNLLAVLESIIKLKEANTEPKDGKPGYEHMKEYWDLMVRKDQIMQAGFRRSEIDQIRLFENQKKAIDSDIELLKTQVATEYDEEKWCSKVQETMNQRLAQAEAHKALAEAKAAEGEPPVKVQVVEKNGVPQ